MTFSRSFLLSAAAMVSLSHSVLEASSLTIDQTKDIQTLVKTYILENPGVVREALQNLAKQEAEEEQQKLVTKAQEIKEQLVGNSTGPLLGNPQGQITVVTFTDPNCGHCRKFQKILEGVAKEEKDLRVLVKDLPIFGEVSEQAVKALFAAHEQGAYTLYHQALVAEKPGIDEEGLLKIAKTLKLNMDQFKASMASEKTKQLIEANKTLAQHLELSGTPLSIVFLKDTSKPPVIIPGLIPPQVLKEVIEGKPLASLMG